MIVNEEIIRTMNYVAETSYRTNPKLESRSEEPISLDYSSIVGGTVTITDEEF